MQSVTGSGRVVAGRYELLDPVGHGAMGTVWRARDLLLDREVAVKEVRVPGPMTHQDRNILRERSLREARVAARLSHPGVVTVHDVIEAGGTPWIIMELVPSRSLAQVLAQDGPLSPARAAVIGMTLLEALGSAHAAGVVHRDVKPGNILVTSEGRVVLTDFGIATLHGDPGLTQAGMVMGTPGFCAPERIRGVPASPASDLWSLGATLYAAVEGRAPFEGQGSAMAVLANIVHGDPPPATSAGPLGPVIIALMRRDPATRPDAIAARRLLAAACAGYDTGAGTAAPGSANGAPAPAGGPPNGRGAWNGAVARDGLAAWHSLTTRDGLAALDGPAALDGAPDGSRRRDPAGAGGVPAGTGVQGGPRATLEFPAAAVSGAAISGAGPPGAEIATTVAAQAQAGLAMPAAPAAPGWQPPQGWQQRAGWQPSAAWQAPQGRAAAQAAEPGQAGRRRPGRHRRALLFGGGGTAVVLAALMLAMGLAHAARLQQIKRMAASGPITPAMALPAGYHWYTARASRSPHRAGFAIAVPDGWRTRQHGDTTVVRDPATDAAITVTRAAPGGPGPLRQAQLLASGPHGAYPGYHQIALLPVPFHGTLAGAWRFAYARPGTGNEQVLELVASLGTQPYELAVTSPRRAWPASRAAFGEALTAFTPQP
jgi:tRNA A-37 threonylcarbamoyl transferase component Bud32